MRDCGRPKRKDSLPARLLPQPAGEVQVQVLRPELSGEHPCRIAAARGRLLSVEGAGRRPLCLPPGSEIRLGFSLLQGWGEVDGRVVGWSAAEGRMIVQCASTGRVLQRRRQDRLAAVLPLACLSGRSGETRDLSRKGMRACFRFRLPEDDLLSFRLADDETGEVRLRGRVVWQRAVGKAWLAGIALAPAPLPTERRYRTLLNRLRRQSRLGQAAVSRKTLADGARGEHREEARSRRP